MDFEYGCITTNKFAFADENEVEDPSDLLVQMTLTKDAKSKKVNNEKINKEETKSPLKQQTDNSIKSKQNDDEKKNSGSYWYFLIELKNIENN